MVRFAVSADIAGAVDREHDRQIVQADIDHHLVIRALQECRIDRHDRLHAGFGEPCCEGYRVLFSDADIERSVGIGVRKTVQPGPVDHGSGDRHDAVISFRQLNHFIAEVRGKIVVTATQMLDSMMHNPRPTRAEATDVANAIYDGTTAIMLSGETASGAYPVEAVRTMSRIAEAAENDVNYRRRFVKRPDEVGADITTAISHSTCMVAQDINAKAIVTVTMSGFTARRISKYKPTCPIVACSVSEPVACQMNLLFGVVPMTIPQEDNEEMLFEAAVMAAKQAGIAEKGDTVILTAGVPLGETGNTNMIRVFEVF